MFSMRKTFFTNFFIWCMVLGFAFTTLAQNRSTSSSLTAESTKGSTQLVREGGGVLLWDNFLTESTTGIVSSEWGGLPAGATQTICADDFIVPTAATWTIDEIAATGFYSPGSIDSDYWGVQFFTDVGGKPGALLATDMFPATPGNSNPSGILSTPVELSDGRYWVAVYGINDTSTDIGIYRWNWFTSEDAQVEFEPHIIDLAGWFGGIPWSPFSALDLNPPFANMMFQLYGTSKTGGGMYKLLLTEFVVTPTAAEFIEIFNPNASPVDLTDYFLSDVAFAGGPEYYYHVVQGVTGGGFGDFNSKFPNGATIGALEHQTIALNGDADFFSTYGVNPTYEIDRDEFRDGPPDAIPDMLETHPGSIFGADSSHNPGLTNGDEMIMLYYWDGMSDLVSDVDYVLYNFASPTPNDEAVNKTGITIDGPDADTLGSTYLDDTPEANQLSALSPTSGFSTQRTDYGEGAQVMSGGNGVTGADETSEDLDNTWVVDIPTPFLAIPVELTSFTASVSDNAVTLNWSTATELNNHGFEIERKSEGSFRTIGFVQGYGTTTETRIYSFIDNNLAVGQHSYRLKQVDFNGTSEFSDIVEVEILAPDVYALVQNYPNPFNPNTKITYSLAIDSKVTLKVFDVLGQEVVTLINGNVTAGIQEINFDASSLNSGVYFYQIKAVGVDGTDFNSVKKMILTK
jgi:hypothetical protein